jgi:hypothetical protein
VKNGHSEYSHPQISNPELRRVAVEAECDPRTVIRYLRDGPTTATARPRIERALTKCGFARLLRSPESPRPDSDSRPPPSER